MDPEATGASLQREGLQFTDDIYVRFGGDVYSSDTPRERRKFRQAAKQGEAERLSLLQSQSGLFSLDEAIWAEYEEKAPSVWYFSWLFAGCSLPLEP